MNTKADFWSVLTLAIVVLGIAVAYVSYDHSNAVIQSIHGPASVVAAVTIAVWFCWAALTTRKI